MRVVFIQELDQSELLGFFTTAGEALILVCKSEYSLADIRIYATPDLLSSERVRFEEFADSKGLSGVTI